MNDDPRVIDVQAGAATVMDIGKVVQEINEKHHVAISEKMNDLVNFYIELIKQMHPSPTPLSVLAIGYILTATGMSAAFQFLNERGPGTNEAIEENCKSTVRFAEATANALLEQVELLMKSQKETRQ